LDLLILDFSVTEGLPGSALPAVEGDELDVTLPKQPQQPAAPKFEKPGEPVANTKAADEEGLSLLQKFVILGFVVALCAVFVKTRSASRTAAAFREKTLA
jgi:peptidyl-prolyl cis-trans isomerase B (cyclophilin B)